MDELCKAAHAKLLSGTCPWCGRVIVAGRVEGQAESTNVNRPPEAPLGQTLQQLVDIQGVLSSEEAATIVDNVARELARLHAANLVHRSLSPSTVILLDEGGVFLDEVDFFDVQSNLSIDVDDEMILGITGYLAPEQALNSRHVDGRADIYSLGYIFYFLLTGRVPFPGQSIAECLLKHQIEDPKPIEVLRDGVPSSLVAICRIMMEK